MHNTEEIADDFDEDDAGDDEEDDAAIASGKKMDNERSPPEIVAAVDSEMVGKVDCVREEPVVGELADNAVNTAFFDGLPRGLGVVVLPDIIFVVLSSAFIIMDDEACVDIILKKNVLSYFLFLFIYFERNFEITPIFSSFFFTSFLL